MTVNVSDTVERFTISGVGPYAYNFRIFAETDLAVTACSTATPPVPASLVYLTHYTVTGANITSGGTVTLTAGAASTYAGYTLDIRSNTPQDQPTSIRNQAHFLPEIHEDAFDHLERQVQDLQRKQSASVHFPDNEILSGEVEAAEVRKGRYLVWDAVTGAISSALNIATTALTQGIFNTYYALTDDHKRTAAEISVGVTPVNYAYPEGYLLRYGTNTAPGTTNMTAALNNATRVCAYGKAVFVLPPEVVLITSTWDCTSSTGVTTTTNGGLSIDGYGIGVSVVKYVGGTNNTGIGWDQTGAAYIVARNFTFIGGSSTSNCPKAAVLQGAVNNTGFIFSGNSTFERVELQGFGDHVIYNGGAEQIDYFNCLGIAWRDESFGSAQPYVFVASGSTPGVTSALVTTYSPTNSMTCIKWHGARAANIFFGSVGINFHFSDSGSRACADIRFDGWFQVLVTTGTFKYMEDDSAGSAGSGLFNCGGENVVLEGATTNVDLNVATFNVALPKGITFKGHLGSGQTITARPFQFGASAVPTDCKFDWDPNESGGWSGDYIVQCAGACNGIEVNTSVPRVNAINVTTDSLVAGVRGLKYHGMASDGPFSSSTLLEGPALNDQSNLFATIRGGARVSALSDGQWVVTTTQNVTTSAVAILTLPGYAHLVAVTGVVNGGGTQFSDLLFVSSTAGTTPLSSQAAVGSPGARTYTIVAGVLKLQMAAGTYDIQATCLGFGSQA